MCMYYFVVLVTYLGNPKGVLLTHENLIANTAAFTKMIPVSNTYYIYIYVSVVAFI